ncbi:MAG: NAD(P)H-hydrate dehydratase, partial [Minisyncoccales bacterium]
MEKINSKILKDIYKKKPQDSKKYDTGFMIVIGGSEFYSGAPAFSALGVYKTGVDMVHIIAPERAANIIASFQPDLATYDLPGERIEIKHLSTLLSLTTGADEAARDKTAVVVGGGMGRSEKTKEVIGQYLVQVPAPAVVDADAIYAINEEVKKGIKEKNFIFTPHIYEFYILTGKKIGDKDLEEKIEVVKEEAKKLNSTILLKGGTDIISDGEKVALNEEGSPYMTVGGTG